MGKDFGHCTGHGRTQSSEKNHILHCSVFKKREIRALAADLDLSVIWTWEYSREIYKELWTCNKSGNQHCQNPSTGLRDYYKVRFSINSGKKWEIYTIKLVTYTKARVSLKSIFTSNTSKLLPIHQNQTWLPEVVYFSKAAATDCSSFYKQCLCHLKRMKWHAASAAVLPISSHLLS